MQKFLKSMIVASLALSGAAKAGDFKGWSAHSEDEVEVIELKSDDAPKTTYMIEGKADRPAPMVCCVPQKTRPAAPAKAAKPHRATVTKAPVSRPVQPTPPQAIVIAAAPAQAQASSGGDRHIVTIDQRRFTVNKDDSDLRRRLREAEARADAAEARAARMEVKARGYYQKYKHAELRKTTTTVRETSSCGGSCGTNACCDKGGLYLGLAAGMAATPYVEQAEDCIAIEGKEFKPYIGARLMGVIGERGGVAVGAQVNSNSSAQLDLSFKVN